MEVREIENDLCISIERKIVEIKVRGDEDFKFYCFPKHIFEKTFEIIKKSNIYLDCLSADDSECSRLPLAESTYSVEEYDESEVYAVNTHIQIEELYELIKYVDVHEEENICVSIFKNSELPEFQVLLDDKECEKLSQEIIELLKQYMKMLLDLSNSDRLGKLLEYHENADAAALLKLYSKNVQEFILSNLSLRFEQELRLKMEDYKHI